MTEFKSINDILDFAINAEQEAFDFYTRMAANARNAEMAATFGEFAREEMKHKARLQHVKEDGVFQSAGAQVQDLKIADFLVKVQPKPDMSYQEALVLAMHREKSAFKLYMRLARQAPDDQLKELFLALAQEESKHKLRFELEYDEYILKEN